MVGMSDGVLKAYQDDAQGAQQWSGTQNLSRIRVYHGPQQEERLACGKKQHTVYACSFSPRMGIGGL